MATYKITSHSGSGRPLNVATTSTISGRTNVNIWNDTGSNDQKWSIASLGSGQQVKSMNNTRYMLNANTSTWNCDVNTSNSDTYVNFKSLGSGLYRIQLDSDQTKYLTAEGTASGSNVKWAALDSASNAQKWKITEVQTPSGGTSKELVVGSQCLWNQYDPVVIDTIGTDKGCTIISGLNAANFYSPKNFTIEDFEGMWGPKGYSWKFPDTSTATLSGEIQTTSYATLRSAVVQQINLGRPLLIRVSNNADNVRHSVVVYGYRNGGATNADILIIDPYNPNDDTVARKTTLDVLERTRPRLLNYRTTQPK